MRITFPKPQPASAPALAPDREPSRLAAPTIAPGVASALAGGYALRAGTARGPALVPWLDGGSSGHILALLILTVVCLALGAGCSRRMAPQSRALDEHSRVTLTDAWILDHTPKLLQALFVYDGVDPNRTYDLQASLRAPGHDSYWGGGWIKQVPIPSARTSNQVQVIWEFLSFPSQSPDLFLSIKYTDKASGLASTVEFKLPGARHLRLRKMGSQ